LLAGAVAVRQPLAATALALLVAAQAAQEQHPVFLAHR
jgi:hypothetical protein